MSTSSIDDHRLSAAGSYSQAHSGSGSSLASHRAWLAGWRSGHEIDLLAETPDGIEPIKVKVTATPSSDAFAGLRQWASITTDEAVRPCLVYGGDRNEHRSDIDIVSWQAI